MLKLTANLEQKLATLHEPKLKERLKAENTYGKSLFKNKTSTDVIQHVTSHDPTPQGSYKRWLTNTYVNKGIRYAEDLSRAKQALTTFDRHKSKLPVNQRDIQQYKSLPDLETAVEPFQKKENEDKSWSDKGKNLIKNGEATELHNDKNYHIVQPNTTEASQHFGINTKWCTAAKERLEKEFK